MTAFPIIDALDQQGLIHYRLFRDSTKYENGVHLKDLGKINRDLSKVRLIWCNIIIYPRIMIKNMLRFVQVIVVDCNDKVVQQHRNNAIILPKWKGNDDDRSLIDLAALLQSKPPI
jgi:import inner membrane translocase subunit TIM50